MIEDNICDNCNKPTGNCDTCNIKRNVTQREQWEKAVLSELTVISELHNR